MMTKQRKQRLKKKIQDSRSRLMIKQPFFALLLMYLKFIAVPTMKKISTNGRCIYFSPDFIDKLYEYELDFILCHQIMHIIHEHIWRPIDLTGDTYHFACDIYINSLLADLGFDEEKYPHLGHVYRHIPGIPPHSNELTPEEIYNSLPYSLYVFDERTRSKFLADSDNWWGKQEYVGDGFELILDIPEHESLVRPPSADNDQPKDQPDDEPPDDEPPDDEPPEDGSPEDGPPDDGSPDDGPPDDEPPNDDSDTKDDASLKTAWRGRVAAATDSMMPEDDGDKTFGNVPGFIKRILEERTTPVLDWKKILNNFLQECICDYSFSPPDRRFADTDFFLPDFNERDYVPKEILFMVDASGSIRDKEIAVVYSEICGAIEQFNSKLTGKLGFFDTVVTTPLPFDTVGDLMRINPYGGGGTDFSVIFEYISNNYTNELPSCVVIFTDGYGPYPAEDAAMKIPVLWLINNNDVTPPWGKIVRHMPTAKP